MPRILVILRCLPSPLSFSWGSVCSPWGIAPNHPNQGSRTQLCGASRSGCPRINKTSVFAAKQHSFFENGTPPLFGWSHMVPRCPKAFKVLHHLFVEQLPLTCSFRSAPGLCNLYRILWDCLIMPVVQLQCVTKQDTYSILSQAFPSCKGVYAYRILQS